MTLFLLYVSADFRSAFCTVEKSARYCTRVLQRAKRIISRHTFINSTAATPVTGVYFGRFGESSLVVTRHVTLRKVAKWTLRNTLSVCQIDVDFIDLQP